MAPVTTTATICPDCAATAVRGHLAHQLTCPMGIANDARYDADREWFAAHPWAQEYRRPPHWSELAELKMWGLIPDVTGETIGRVTVCQVAPGVRARRFGDVAIIFPAVPR